MDEKLGKKEELEKDKKEWILSFKLLYKLTH